jgi:shikimate kinase
MAAPPMDRYAPLKARTIALVGMMGVGKSSVGRRLASALDLPFYDADSEVERAAGCSINDIFTDLGEAAFREGERRVIARLLEGPPQGARAAHGRAGASRPAARPDLR